MVADLHLCQSSTSSTTTGRYSAAHSLFPFVHSNAHALARAMHALTFAVLSHSLALQSWLPLSSVIRSTRTLEQRSLSFRSFTALPRQLSALSEKRRCLPASERYKRYKRPHTTANDHTRLQPTSIRYQNDFDTIQDGWRRPAMEISSSLAHASITVAQASQ